MHFKAKLFNLQKMSKIYFLISIYGISWHLYIIYSSARLNDNLPIFVCKWKYEQQKIVESQDMMHDVRW